MAEQAAHLVEAVLPTVPVRQWVLTVPHRLRYRLAFDHALCRAVLGVFIRAVLSWYRRRGRRAGVPDGQSGTVTVVQRFGSGLELNVHFHALGLDGVFAPGADGTLCFHRLPPPSDADVARLVATIARRADGTVLVALKTPWRDGTTHLCFEPVTLLERLAALTPRPRINVVLYHGILAPRAKWRAAAVAYGRPEAPAAPDDPAPIAGRAAEAVTTSTASPRSAEPGVAAG